MTTKQTTTQAEAGQMLARGEISQVEACALTIEAAKATSRKTRQDAQTRLMHAMQMAFCEEGLDVNEIEHMQRQFRRVAKLFGYIPGSWSIGA